MVRYAALAAILTAFALAPAAARGAGWESAPRAFVVLRDASPAALSAFADRLEAAGGHASVILSSGAAIVYAGDAVLARPEIAGALEGAFRSRLDPPALEALEPGRRLSGAAWNEALALGDLDAPGPAEAPSHPRLADAGPRPVALAKRTGATGLDAYTHIPYGADYYDTSEFLAGRVAVAVWLLEDPGATYNWSSTEISQTLGGVQAALDNWVRKGGAPPFLTFFLETHTGVPVSAAPIEYSIDMAETWVNEVLGNLGWPGANGYERCFAVNNSIRNVYATNWCYSIFIVDSSSGVNQGLFAGGGYAFALFGGPWVWMSRYSTWAYNYTRYYGVVPMHETGHIFMDTDEYNGALENGGYLDAPDNDYTQCIMNQNDSTRVCPETRNQLGWRDLDGDGIIDPLDVPPTTALTPTAPDPTSDTTPTWNGRAHVATLPNLNPLSNNQPPHDQTIARLSTVECRVDGGDWSAATASDGAFDAYGEDFTWTPPALAEGTHVVEARALDSVGNWSGVYARDTVTVTGTVHVGPSRPAFALCAPAPDPAVAGATFRFSLPGPGRVRITLAGVNGARVRVLLEGHRPAGPGAVAWDGRDDAGRRVAPGIYGCRIDSPAGSAWRRFAVVR
ncbi:MAG TPA: hypothetical protein VGK89_04100 [Candidatus Eisenbacteria bacterium]|jgi:hypothetical protein